MVDFGIVWLYYDLGGIYMLQYERFEKIMDLLETQPTIRVADLVSVLGASESTIRRDIAQLDEEGRLRKVFGGAVSLELESGQRTNRNVNAPKRTVDVKEQTQVDEKTQVAACAASLIENGDLVYLDAGTTTGSMIEHIKCHDAVYVTNGARHALQLARRGFKVYLLSGQVKVSTEAIIGYDAVGSLQKYHFSKCFIGTDGIDLSSGLTTSDIEESMVKTEAIQRSEKVYILADSSKFGLVAAITFAPLSAGQIITDRLPDDKYRSKADIKELNTVNNKKLHE